MPRRLSIRLDSEGEENLETLRSHGYTNVSNLIKDLIAQKVQNIQNEIASDGLISASGFVEYDATKKELIIHDYRIHTSQPGMVHDLIKSGKAIPDEKNHTLHIRI